MKMVTIVTALAGAGIGALSERYAWQWFPNYKDVNVLVTGNDDQLEQTALTLAKTYLVAEEGRRNRAYLDSRGVLTVGIGHAITANDGEWSVGDLITEESIDELFAYDVAKAFNAAVDQAKEINRYNAVMVARLTSVNFQLGTNWRAKFPNTWSLIKTGTPDTIIKAVKNIKDSAWASQTPSRAYAFATQLEQQFLT